MFKPVTKILGHEGLAAGMSQTSSSKTTDSNTFQYYGLVNLPTSQQMQRLACSGLGLPSALDVTTYNPLLPVHFGLPTWPGCLHTDP